MSLVKPCNENNAIKIAALAFEFKSNKARDELVEKLINIYEENKELRSKLPRFQTHESITFNYDGDNQSVSRPTVSGVTFDILTPSGEQEWAVTLREDAFIVTCTEYDRWATFWAKAESFLNQFISAFDKQKTSVVSVEYVDEFEILEPTKTEWKKELFNTRSPFLPANIFELDDLWHTHNGYFCRKEDGSELDGKVLNIININYGLDREKNHIVSMRTQNKTLLKEPQDIKALYQNGNAKTIFESNHELNKRVMKGLLSPNMLKRIKLGE